MTKSNKTNLAPTLCNGCYCVTKSIIKRESQLHCGKCGYDKTLDDTHNTEIISKKVLRGGVNELNRYGISGNYQP